MRTKKARGAVTLGLMLAATGAMVGVSAAPAMASTCHTSLVNDRTAKGYCTGTASYRLFVLCEENSGNTYTAGGALAWGGTDSYATCHEAAWVIDRWMVQY